MSIKKILINISLIFILFIPFVVNGKTKDINIYLFYGDGCPHCKEETKWLNEYLEEKENINFYRYEVWKDSKGKKIFLEVQDLLDKSATGVPYLVIGNQVVIGYSSSTTPEKIEYIINYYQNDNYRDLVGEHLGITEVRDDIILEKDIFNSKIKIPWLGEIDPKVVSIPFVAIVLGLVDGFNPCAMWILLFLITALFGMKNKKKMWILGGTFLLTSAVVYALFMVSWLNLAVFLNKILIIRMAIALIAVIFGGINISRYFTTKDVGCDVVDTKKRSKIMDKIKKIVTEKAFILSIFGIIALAFSVNLIELVCSLGLPMVFTQILSLNNLSILEETIYIIIYILFFLVDDIIIFVIAMLTLNIKAISNKYTKYSHLIGGIIMLLIGVLLIVKPEWLMFNF